MTALSLHNLHSNDHLVAPAQTEPLRLTASALDLFADFRTHEPGVIAAGLRALDAARIMCLNHAEVRLVAGIGGEFLGIVTRQSLSELNLLKRIAATGESRDSVRVGDLMRVRRELRALEYDDLMHASVRDVIDTLRCHGEQHCLVVDTCTHDIRGLIAASDLAWRLPNVPELATPTFSDIFAAVHHPTLLERCKRRA